MRRSLAYQWQLLRSDRRAWLKWWWREWGEPLVVAAVIALVIRTFALGPYKIPTGSMKPTLLEGDRIFVDKVTYRFRGPVRGDIIVFKYPDDPKKDFVKRLIAFGGEDVMIRDGEVYVNGEKLQNLVGKQTPYYDNRSDWLYGREGQVVHVPEDSFFVLGDNSRQSSDSRRWGFVPKTYLVGRAFFIWWPLERMGLLH
ncbi:MAG: signal peptidase I [Omnitrophica bacterium RIFCSPLOWO2_12_FULL_50_11]|nr:MAG: signal peptidase I [Omnitrophica bacterium RIFCSPLOWO2_12_FULL_50_11]